MFAVGIRHRSGPFFYIANGRRSRASFIERKAIETNRQALRGNEEVTMNQDYNAYASCPAGKPGAKEDISGASFMLAPMTDRSKPANFCISMYPHESLQTRMNTGFLENPTSCIFT